MLLRYEIDDVTLNFDSDREEWVRFTRSLIYESSILYNGFNWFIVNSIIIKFYGDKATFSTVFRIKREL